MQKWEYLFVSPAYGQDNVQYAYMINAAMQKNWQKGITLYQFSNQLGNDGWEIADVTGQGTIIIFKRPKP